MTASGVSVLVAGAAGGVGRAVALAAASEGATVLLLGRDRSSLDRVRAEVAEAGGTAHVAVADATSAAQVDDAVAALRRDAGGIDVVVNAVGINLKARHLDELDEAGWRSVLDSNLTAAFFLTRAALAGFRAGGGGLLIHISSVAALVPDLSGAAYQASKAGLAALARATALEASGDGVRVTTISPGLIDTGFVRHRPTTPTPEELAGALRPEDVAEMCLAVIRLPARATVSEVVMRPTGR
ncbi:SDR family oxidoreductase [Leifsonia soli]|uniref:NAD(P)-dependent dehydrogenase (Short-subunit alcohol dehydrogenase family) n=2 Tax=Bacillati TaxID=1783272 RepID=A0A852T4M2_9MICO|nr:SDR family oxidoreductase [Leifsonia soli]NYD75763.1 NAD(P)-dependent dehydrogenase (short-subunit alcohol dehydrogenase family) [Leifsonia soli]